MYMYIHTHTVLRKALKVLLDGTFGNSLVVHILQSEDYFLPCKPVTEDKNTHYEHTHLFFIMSIPTPVCLWMKVM